MYKVIQTFADLTDFEYIYKVGDVYPRDGYTPSKERIEELSSSKNRLKTPLIKAEKEKVAVMNEPIEEAEAEDKDKVVAKKRKKKAEEE